MNWVDPRKYLEAAIETIAASHSALGTEALMPWALHQLRAELWIA